MSAGTGLSSEPKAAPSSGAGGAPFSCAPPLSAWFVSRSPTTRALSPGIGISNPLSTGVWGGRPQSWLEGEAFRAG